MRTTSAAQQSATVRSRWSLRPRFCPCAMVVNLTAVSLERSVHDVAAQAGDRGDVEQDHECRQRQRDRNRSRLAPSFPFALLLIAHASETPDRPRYRPNAASNRSTANSTNK